MPKDHGLTLDSIATAQFRGFYGQNSVCFYPEIEDTFYSSRLLDEVKSYWHAAYAKPTLMLFNICGPHQSGLSPHLDAVTFRGVRIENSPVWLQNIMGKSGLFTDHIINMAQVITWWYRGEAGTFTYWPDGPLASAEDARPPPSGTAASSCRTSSCSIAATRSDVPTSAPSKGSSTDHSSSIALSTTTG